MGPIREKFSLSLPGGGSFCESDYSIIADYLMDVRYFKLYQNQQRVSKTIG